MSDQKLTPLPRPNNLNKLSEFPKEPPVPVPEDGSDEATFKWCEAIKTYYEERGFYVSPKGLLKFADLAGLDEADLKETKSQIKKLYAAEFAQIVEKKSKKSEPKTKEKNVTATKEKPKKKVKKIEEKPVKKSKHDAKPSKNGKHDAKKPVKAKAPPRDESETVYEASIKGIPVAVQQTATGRYSVTFGGFAMRKMAAFLGKKGWLVGEVKQVYNRLLAKWKEGEEYVKNVLEEGHVGSGAKANKIGKYAFGTLPDVDKETYRAMNSLKK